MSMLTFAGIGWEAHFILHFSSQTSWVIPDLRTYACVGIIIATSWVHAIYLICGTQDWSGIHREESNLARSSIIQCDVKKGVFFWIKRKSRRPPDVLFSQQVCSFISSSIASWASRLVELTIISQAMTKIRGSTGLNFHFVCGSCCLRLSWR